MKTFLDFGAVGNGVADDTQAVKDGLLWAFNLGRIISGAGLIYKLTSGITIPSSANIVSAFGLEGDGCRFVSSAADLLPMFTVEARHQCRGFRWNEGWASGAPGMGDGLRIVCDKDWPGAQYFWDWIIDSFQFEGFENGVSLIGDVFEGVLRDVYAQDNRKNGFYFAHLGAGGNRGKVSAVNLENCNASQNGVGVRTANYTTNGYDAAYDIRCRGGYMRENKEAAIFFKNGHTPSGCVQGVGFENNWNKYPSISAAEAEGATTAHIHSSSRLIARDCSFHTRMGGARWSVLVGANDLTVLSNCVGSTEGVNKGKLRLARIEGGIYSFENCSGAMQ